MFWKKKESKKKKKKKTKKNKKKDGKFSHLIVDDWGSNKNRRAGIARPDFVSRYQKQTTPNQENLSPVALKFFIFIFFNVGASSFVPCLLDLVYVQALGHPADPFIELLDRLNWPRQDTKRGCIVIRASRISCITHN